MNPSSPSTQPWHGGDAYERYMGRWSRQLAPRFLAWLRAPGGARWLDVGCGTGALCAAIVDQCAPQSVVGVDPSKGFLAKAASHLAGGVTLHRASADALPLADGAVDFAVSGLVLNFVPDAQAALREMTRVTADGGCVGVYVWDYGGTMDLIRRYWDAAAEVDPLARSQHQGERFPLCAPEPLAAALREAGLQNVAVQALDLTMPFADFDDYWQPFLGGQGPAPAHAMSLDEATRARLVETLRERLPREPDGRIVLAARAWAARGTTAH